MEQVTPKVLKKCEDCGKTFLVRKNSSRTRCAVCKGRRWENGTPDFSCGDDTQTGSIGAVSELLVSSILLAKGYFVFRSVSPNSPFDLIAVKDDKFLIIEVRAGTISTTGNITYQKKDNVPDSTIYAIHIRTENSIIFFDGDGERIYIE